MLPLLTILILTPALMEYCLLRCGGKRVTRCAIIAALVTGLVFTFLVLGPTWGVPMIDSETARTSGDRAIGSVIITVASTFIFSCLALIPAGVFGFVFHKFNGFRR